ncbi:MULTISPECIES: hypothetical protein [Desulfobacula]|uniref:Uncharacterized protein n=2 Tax=Desulfobacula TaxID=28222 RepID=K0NJ11_DESTT|nr:MULTISPECIES: hypothetical protein [Desulfobacula]CCK81456.1 uncharacterized protein TOL2_C32990 [Desulfobacula toluolica Tol2]SDU29448.1 hypothetical protein SAMN04487931_106163 [Desulfobacula phenolica]
MICFKKKMVLTVTAIAVFFAITASVLFAHTLYMNVLDNEDGTVTVEGMFSTGSEASGLPLYLEDTKGEVIKKLKMDESGEITFKAPDVPYMIFLDGGPGHTLREEGPLNQ